MSDTTRDLDPLAAAARERVAAAAGLAELEGLIPAFESAHAFAPLFQPGRFAPGTRVLVNLSGRGDKDMESAVRLLKL